MKCYVGVGSSAAPAPILSIMTRLAAVMVRRGITLRTSTQPGPDEAFRQGSSGKFFTFLPDDDLSGKTVWGIPSDLTPSGADATLARKLNPTFLLLPEPEKRWEIVANSVVLGLTPDSTAKMVICWTPDGAICEADFTGKTGHTARYLKVAERFGVPVFNLARKAHLDQAFRWLTA